MPAMPALVTGPRSELEQMTLQFDHGRFLERDWQRRPALLRGALPGFVSPINGDDLAGLAAEPEALARLVSRSGQRWQLRRVQHRARARQ